MFFVRSTLLCGAARAGTAVVASARAIELGRWTRRPGDLLG